MIRTEYKTHFETIDQIMERIQNKDANVNKDFKSFDFDWTANSKEQLIKSIFYGFPIGNLVLWINDAGVDIIDGRSVFKTIIEFISGDFSLSSQVSRKIVNKYNDILRYESSRQSNLLLKKYEENKNFKLKYKDISLIMKDHFDKYQIPVVEIWNTNPEELNEYLGAINNQRKESSKNLEHSLPQSEITKELNKIDCSRFLRFIEFTGDINDFKMIIVMMHGLFMQKLSLNASKSKVLKYAQNTNDVSQIFFHRIRNLMDEVLNSRKLIFRPATKSHLKLLILLKVFTHEVDNIEIGELNKKISIFLRTASYFNSNKRDSLWRREELRGDNRDIDFAISLLKGEHSANKVQQILPIVIHFIHKT